MAIVIDRDREFYPAIKKIMDKLDKLEKKIDLINKVKQKPRRIININKKVE